MNPASRSGHPSPRDAAGTAQPATPADRPGRAPGRVWTWSRSCGRFARSLQGSQDAGMRRPGPDRRPLVGDLGLKLAGLRDQLLDRLFRGQDAHQFALGIDVFHVLRQPGRIAQREFTYRGDAGSAHQPDLCLAHAGNPHVVGNFGPFEQLLLANAGLRCKRLASLDGARGLEQCVGGTDAKRLQFRRGEGGQAVKLGNWIFHDAQYERCFRQTG